MDQAQKSKLVAELKSLESTYETYRHLSALEDLKLRTFDVVWKIFSTTVISPEAASFNVGRLVQALDEYGTIMRGMKRYEDLVEKLAEDAKRKEG